MRQARVVGAAIAGRADSGRCGSLLRGVGAAGQQGGRGKNDNRTNHQGSLLEAAGSLAGQAESNNSDGADPVPLWRSLRELGVNVLTEKAKDLEVAA